jgi:hypothetical protein
VQTEQGNRQLCRRPCIDSPLCGTLNVPFRTQPGQFYICCSVTDRRLPPFPPTRSFVAPRAWTECRALSKRPNFRFAPQLIPDRGWAGGSFVTLPACQAEDWASDPVTLFCTAAVWSASPVSCQVPRACELRHDTNSSVTRPRRGTWIPIPPTAARRGGCCHDCVGVRNPPGVKIKPVNLNIQQL